MLSVLRVLNHAGLRNDPQDFNKLSRLLCNKEQDEMAALVCRLLLLAWILGAVQLISGYSFMNCIEESSAKGQTFKCIHRKESNMTAIVLDLPPSTVNLTIVVNPVHHIPNGTFAHLPNLQNLRLDHNILNVTDPLAFQNLTQLKSLNLSYNYISELSPSLFNDLHSLSFLSLTHNNLKTLPEGLFSTAVSLNVLLIRENYLTNFTGIAESVSHLKNLSKLDLCFNNLTSLNHSNVSLPESLTTLYIRRNNLSTLGCNGSFLRFVQVLDLSYNARLHTVAFQGVDLKGINYLRLQSTGVHIVDFLNITNVPPGHVDFSGTSLNNDTKLTELCRFLKLKLQWIKNLDLSSNV